MTSKQPPTNPDHNAGSRAGDTRVREFLVAAGFPPQTEVATRRIGTDEAMVTLILKKIACGEKSMTFSLPWVAEELGQRQAEPGDLLLALDASGAPAALLRLERIDSLTFGAVDAETVSREGLAMRDPAAWRALHEQVWNARLSELGLAERGQVVTGDMPVWAEYFELLHCAEAYRSVGRS
jgi:uncharacterized protein YhfF